MSDEAMNPNSDDVTQKGEKIIDNALELVHLRNHFYQDGHRKLIKLVLCSFAVIAALVLLLVYVLLTPPQPKYFAVSQDGRMVKLIPLNQPNMSPATLSQWATDATLAAYSYNFVNYRRALQTTSNYFTPKGWRLFSQALENSNNLALVKAKKLVVSGVVSGAPVILWKGNMPDGRYAWRVQLPLTVTYQSASQVSRQQVVVTLLVVRMSPLFSIRGLGIDQFIVANGKS